jgi:hypothetical protein
VIIYVRRGTETEEMYEAADIVSDIEKRTIIGYDNEGREVFGYRGVNDFDAFEIVAQ